MKFLHKLNQWWKEFTAPPKTIPEICTEAVKNYFATPEFMTLVLDSCRDNAAKRYFGHPEKLAHFNKRFNELLKTESKPIVQLSQQATREADAFNP